MKSDHTFLGSVADYYMAGAEGRPAASTVTFVLPNKRSALFLKKYVQERIHGIALMPRFMTMPTFLGIYSDYPATQPRELLFVLYDAYRRVMSRKGRVDAVRQFDSFIFWGDMMLNDFDDVDKALVDADDIFRNLKNVKEIQADYLDEDQKEVIRRVWGESRLTAHIEEFWLHLGNGEECLLGEKFVYLWEVLSDIYHEYKACLKNSHRASEGTLYRLAVENVKNYEAYDFTGDTRYAFVGFNDLTAAETVIFERLKRKGVASFFWDTAPLSLFSEENGRRPQPLQRLADLARHFPMPDDYTLPVKEKLPKICVASVPSNVAQAKCIGKVLELWKNKECLDPANAINTAIVLPDQGLLLPTLLSIPEDIKALNISMSLTYRTTTFASLLHSIISMQLRARKIRGEYNFYFEDLNAVLSHPHIQSIAPEAADRITAFVNGNKMYNAPARELCEVAPELKEVFTPVRDSGNVRETAAYLGALLDCLGAGLSQKAGKEEAERGSMFELEAIKYFREELDKLCDLIERYKVEMADRTFMHLFERVFSNRGLPLTGTPLQGLQVLGVLETRGLDFDNVIILSMNEGMFPRKQYTRTMIPNHLRSGFGLTDFDSPEWSYAYSFYRLISRAKNVALFYDSRAEGIGLGEKSRYISQLEHLVPGIRINNMTLVTGATAGDKRQFEVQKTPDVLKILDGFRRGGNKRLSASAMKTYLECPFSFYLKYVRNMRDDDELKEGLTAAEIGTIVHGAIQRFFESYADRDVDAATMDSWLGDEGLTVHDAVVELMRKVHYKGASAPGYEDFTAEMKINVRNIEELVRCNLEAEREAYCKPSFRFIANEYEVNTIKENTVWHLDEGLDVNFYMSVDRVDEIAPGYLRFIDFKTGGDQTSVGSMDNLFDKYAHSNGGIFQLLLYSEAYLSLRDESCDIQPMLHPLRNIASGKSIQPLTINKQPVSGYKAVRNDFRPRLVELIRGIFDPSKPFTQCEDSKNCTYCPFLTLCSRTIKNF